MRYAVIQTGGKQYRVSEGDVIEVERLTNAPSNSFVFDQVLLYVADEEMKLGTPVISGMTVMAEVIDHVRGEKIRVAKFKAKARYRRVTGHRQALTKVKITQIGSETAKKTEKSNTKIEQTTKKAADKPSTQKKVSKKGK